MALRLAGHRVPAWHALCLGCATAAAQAGLISHADRDQQPAAFLFGPSKVGLSHEPIRYSAPMTVFALERSFSSLVQARLIRLKPAKLMTIERRATAWHGMTFI